MKTLQTGSDFKIYDDSLTIFDQLPVATYNVTYSQLEGFSLHRRTDIEVSEKAYGIHIAKLDKVLNSFRCFSRSLGVILSGDKGIGKSLFAKMVCVRAIREGYPVIIVGSCVPGLAAFLESIDQECVVLFDEFDKIFRSGKENDDQTSLLSLFDGTSGGKKLFIVTCNDLFGLNQFIINRPGRFHYHFRFDYPTPTDIREYLRDKLDECYYGEIEKVVDFSRIVSLNYDCLRAIAFELNFGCSFASAISDLNIMTTDDEEYTVFLFFDNGVRLQQLRYSANLYSAAESEPCVYLYDANGHYITTANYDRTRIVYDQVRRSTIVPPEGIRLEWDDDDDVDKHDKPFIQDLKAAKPLYMSFVKKSMQSYHYAF